MAKDAMKYSVGNGSSTKLVERTRLELLKSLIDDAIRHGRRHFNFRSDQGNGETFRVEVENPSHRKRTMALLMRHVSSGAVPTP
jgi:hypothetical protein